MKVHVIWGSIFWIVLAGFIVSQVESVNYYAETSSAEIKVNDKRFVEDFRAVPWCVNGLDEPEFQTYPFNEFVPFLQQTGHYVKPKPSELKYVIKIREVKLKDDLESFHQRGRLHSTAHFSFYAMKKKYFSQGLSNDFFESEIEGLIVQMDFAPYGVGLPTGSFLYPEDLSCSDCTKPQGRPIGCKRKTFMNFMHPTILVYHHRMKTSKEEQDRYEQREKNENYKKVCVNRTTLIPPKLQQECAADSVCTAVDPETKCAIPRRVSYCNRDPDVPDAITGLIPDGQCEKREDCKSTWFSGTLGGEVDCEPVEPPLKDTAADYVFQQKYIVGKTSEVHGNFVWYTHPCHSTRAVRFLIMVVHSFSNGIYYIMPYEEAQEAIAFNLPAVVDDEFRNPLFSPSPIFKGFEHTCGGCDSLVFDKIEDSRDLEDIEKLHPKSGNINFESSKAYDACIRKRDAVEKVWCDGKVPEFKSSKFKPPPSCSGAPDPKATPEVRKAAAQKVLDSRISKRRCPTCPPLPSTTTEAISTTTQAPLFKRNFHGGVNFITNFCIMPVTVFIARFYKETFNLHAFKGVKLWYWMHLFGSGGSSVLMYFGYFSKGFVDDFDLHVVCGNVYIMVLAFAYITAWGRHKNPKLSAVAEIVHGLCGYGCFALAIACMLTVEGLHDFIKIFVFTTISILGIFYIGMEAHICALDKRFGMTPKRRHFPTIEARFDDLPVPGSKGRIIVLILLSIVVFALCMCTVFF